MRRPELWSLDLAAEHFELVAKNGDLCVLDMLAAEALEQHADEPAAPAAASPGLHSTDLPSAIAITTQSSPMTGMG